MRTILHASDPHFGRADRIVVKQFLVAASRAHPDLVVISGDLTQRARVPEFLQVRDFIDDLRGQGSSVFVIPGNHDVRPLYQPIARLCTPYDRYQKYIQKEIAPHYLDREIALCALNTVRRLRLVNGAAHERQVAETALWFNTLDNNQIRIVVSHHPFDLPKRSVRLLARGARCAIEGLAPSRIDLYLAGHHHHSSAFLTSDHYPHISAAIVSQAGTLSRRTYGEVQSFNLLHIDTSSIRIETYSLGEYDHGFAITETRDFARKAGVWCLSGDV